MNPGFQTRWILNLLIIINVFVRILAVALVSNIWLLWSMGGKAKCRCHFGMLKVSRLRHSHLNVKLENDGPNGECLNDIQ
jgi:hypothetical protein